MSLRFTFTAVALLASLCACSGDKAAAVTYKYLHQVSGKTATDCGYARFGESTSRTNQCVLDAYKKHHPFLARYDVKGLDSWLVVGLAGDGTDKVVSVKYDSEGWQRAERDGASLAESNHVLLTPCPTPVELRTKQSGYLACDE